MPVNMLYVFPVIHILLIPVHLRVVSHRNIRRKHKLRKSVISSSFVNIANSHYHECSQNF